MTRVIPVRTCQCGFRMYVLATSSGLLYWCEACDRSARTSPDGGLHA